MSTLEAVLFGVILGLILMPLLVRLSLWVLVESRQPKKDKMQDIAEKALAALKAKLTAAGGKVGFTHLGEGGEGFKLVDFEQFMAGMAMNQASKPADDPFGLRDKDNRDEQLDYPLVIIGEEGQTFETLGDLIEHLHPATLVRVHEGICEWCHFVRAAVSDELIPEPDWYAELVALHDTIVETAQKRD